MPGLPGTLTEVTATADDGQPPCGHGWRLPHGDEPAPLVLWIHGGPLASWNAWHWRWNPWLLVAKGYAVLMPDPALSTGYGQDFIQRGWGAWGFAPYTDLIAATDAACAHPRVDETRTAAMGGSFGGYMANWIAGHTDRFDAIVTHASLWALDQFGPTTDGAYWWAREMTPEMAEQNSPHRFVGDIATPMLVIHGDKDYRVPIGEALRLWYELLTESGLPAAEDGTSPHRFLYFPSESHWVLTPPHAKIWYQVVTAFLARHVLGEDVELPETLGWSARVQRPVDGAMQRQREFDIVLYGATGFVGKLTAEYLAKAGGDARIALAGRSHDKLRAVRDTLGESCAVVAADRRRRVVSRRR